MLFRILLCLPLFFFLACQNEVEMPAKTKGMDSAIQGAAMLKTMQKHLDAVSGRDLATLESTLSPSGKMQLILPGTETSQTVEEFMDYHRAWFQDTTWTFETNIKNSVVGPEVGMAITEVVYREPERDGVPYFNRMTVSYVLQQQDGQWYVIKDHASSVEKSTDKKMMDE